MPNVNTLFSTPNPAPPGPFAPIRPPGWRVVLDATDATTFRLGGVQASDGSLFDTWQDQSGHGFDATQLVLGSQPFVDSLGLSAGRAAVLGGRGIPLFNEPTFLNFTGLTFQIPYVLVALVRADSNQRGLSPSLPMTIAEVSTNVAASPGILLSSNNAWAARTRGPGGTQNVDTNIPLWWAGNNQFDLVFFENDGTNAALSLNGLSVPLTQSGPAPGAGAIVTNGTLGASHGVGSPLTGSIAFFGIRDALTATERGQLTSYLRAAYTLTTPNQGQKYNPLAIGDSIAGGANLQGSGTGASFHSQTPWAFSGRACIGMGPRFGIPFNIAVSGARLLGGANLPDITTQGTLIEAQFVAGFPVLLFIEGGVNSLGTDTAANILAQYLAIVSARVATLNALAGGPHHIFCATITFFHGISPSEDTDRLTINAGIRAALPGLATPNVHLHLVDAGGDAMLGSAAGNIPGNVNFFETDGLHPAKTGQERFGSLTIAQMVAAGL